MFTWLCHIWSVLWIYWVVKVVMKHGLIYFICLGMAYLADSLYHSSFENCEKIWSNLIVEACLWFYVTFLAWFLVWIFHILCMSFDYVFVKFINKYGVVFFIKGCFWISCHFDQLHFVYEFLLDYVIVSRFFRLMSCESRY